MRKYLETNENKITTYQHLWDAAKAVLTGQFIIADDHIKKDLKPTNLTLHFKKAEEQTKSKVS